MKRSEIKPPIIPKIKDWPVNKLYSDRDGFVREVSEFTLKRIMAHPPEKVSHEIARAAYLELIRIKEEPWKVDLKDEKQFWRKTKKQLADQALNKDAADQAVANEKILRKILDRYSDEIVGGFKVKTFRFARKFLTQFFKIIFNTAWSFGKGRLFGNRHELWERIKVYGQVDELRNLMQKGTVVLVPTHFSNLDSIMVGYALDQVAGVPAFTYGAGLNLFNNSIIARFMNRLGAYKVDRRKKNAIYLETLKGMSNLAIQRGTNSLFFPGGTRSRSGSLEKRLKLGLLGTAVEAQRALLQKDFKRKVYVVPVVIGYNFVLEAKSLIQQHLKKTGEELFIEAKKDESRSIGKIIRFAWQQFSRSSEITLTFGEPMDVIGNRVNEKGESLSQNGEVLDFSGYFKWDGEINTDLQREAEYTRRLADRIVDSFHRNNLVMSSHLVAFTAFRILKKNNPANDIYSLLRLPTEDFSISFSDFCEEVDKIRKQLFELEKNNKIMLADEIKWNLDELVKDGLENIGLYHDKNPLGLDKSEKNVISKDFELLYFYHNRLENFGLSVK